MVPPSILASIDPAIVLQAPEGYTIAPPAGDAPPNTRAQFMTAVYPPSATTVLAALHAGYFDCEWGDPPPNHHHLRVAVLPNASESFDSYTRSTVYDIATFDGLAEGTRAFGGCANGDDRYCDIQALSGTTWVSVHEADADVSAATSAAFRARLETIVRSSIAAVSAAGSLVSTTEQPSTRWQTVGDCAAIDQAVRTIDQTAAAESEKKPLDQTGASDPVFRAAVNQSGSFFCRSSAAVVTVVPGADVSAPVVYTKDATPPVPVSIPGVVSARDSCVASAPTECWTEGYIDHALVTISKHVSATQRHAILAAVAVRPADPAAPRKQTYFLYVLTLSVSPESAAMNAS
jgi:hypothetical protein